MRLEPTPAEPTRAKSSEPVAKSSPRPATKKSAVPAQAESLPAISSQPATSAAQAPPTDHIAEAPANAHQRFCIIAGSFPTNDMAKAEKDHLARLTTYRVWVTKAKVNGARTFHLMVGRFDTMEHAWEAGQTLMRRGLIRDANVQPLSE
jgi:cell division protein FtsN